MWGRQHVSCDVRCLSACLPACLPPTDCLVGRLVYWPQKLRCAAMHGNGSCSEPPLWGVCFRFQGSPPGTVAASGCAAW